LPPRRSTHRGPRSEPGRLLTRVRIPPGAPDQQDRALGARQPQKVSETRAQRPRLPCGCGPSVGHFRLRVEGGQGRSRGGSWLAEALKAEAWQLRRSALDSRRSPGHKRLDLVKRCHGGVAWEGGEECAVCPTEADCLVHRESGEQAVEEARGKAVPPEGFNNPDHAARRYSWIKPPSTSLRSTGVRLVLRTCGVR
jgi:hypothetical protein